LNAAMLDVTEDDRFSRETAQHTEIEQLQLAVAARRRWEGATYPQRSRRGARNLLGASIERVERGTAQQR
jgi:hypothetical protein